MPADVCWRVCYCVVCCGVFAAPSASSSAASVHLRRHRRLSSSVGCQVGYGDISATTSVEMLGAIVAMIIGTIVFSLTVGMLQVT
eukprot:COSAG05_NODE_436_length_9838_cov_49.389876_11_plen_85_part_00